MARIRKNEPLAIYGLMGREAVPHELAKRVTLEPQSLAQALQRPKDRFRLLYANGEEKLRKQLASVPWAFLEAHSAQAIKNHAQTLTALNARGGLCPSEMVAVIEDRPWKPLVEAAALEKILTGLAIWQKQEGERP